MPDPADRAHLDDAPSNVAGAFSVPRPSDDDARDLEALDAVLDGFADVHSRREDGEWDSESNRVLWLSARRAASSREARLAAAWGLVDEIRESAVAEVEGFGRAGLSDEMHSPPSLADLVAALGGDIARPARSQAAVRDRAAADEDARRPQQVRGVQPLFERLSGPGGGGYCYGATIFGVPFEFDGAATTEQEGALKRLAAALEEAEFDHLADSATTTFEEADAAHHAAAYTERDLAKMANDFKFAVPSKPLPAWLRRRIAVSYPRLILQLREAIRCGYNALLARETVDAAIAFLAACDDVADDGPRDQPGAHVVMQPFREAFSAFCAANDTVAQQVAVLSLVAGPGGEATDAT